MKKVLIILATAGLLQACMYKSVMTGEADDIRKARIYNYDGKDYMVMLESVFQATSKSGGRGITTITGFDELRISVYNLHDGSMVARKKQGRLNRIPMEFLGCTEGNIWCYSKNNGIHSLDPETLEIKITQETIFERNPELKDNLATCEWYQTGQYFQFNEISRQIILTDNKGFRYFLDPDSLLASKITWEYTPFDPRTTQNFETHISFPPPVISISGDLRKQIRINNTEVNHNLTFFDGKFIADRNAARVAEGIRQRLSANMISLEAIYPKLQELKELNEQRGLRYGTPQRDSLYRLENFLRSTQNDIQRMENSLRQISGSGYTHDYTPFLSPDTTTFLVFHSSGTAKDANVVISRIHKKNNLELNEIWSAEIPGLFFNPSAAAETNTFREIFSKGSPEFKFSHIDMEDNFLVIVWMLHVHCLDIETGKILWKFRV